MSKMPAKGGVRDASPQTASLSKTTPVSGWLILFLATACGLIAANLYYAQPLVGPISAELGLSPRAAGLIVTMTQVGYGIGLLLIVPLGDLFENRKLVMTVIALGAAALLASGLAITPGIFLTAALFIGIGSVAVQILVPYAAHLATDETRGRVVGNVMSGLMFGIMLSRPVSSFLTELTNWRVIFFVSTAMMIVMMVAVRLMLPVSRPTVRPHYFELLGSMARLMITSRVLRRRALYQASLFATFSLFWTTVPLLLAGPDFNMSQAGIALFALAGAAGAVAAPIGGRMADRGWVRPATAIAMASVPVALMLTHLGTMGSVFSLVILVLGAIMLDFGLTCNMVLGQRAIFSLGAAYRNRINGVYMATFFAAGAIGSAVGGWAFAHGGWMWATAVGMLFPAMGLLYYLTEYLRPLEIPKAS
ncbi:MFS transporter [Thalassospira sp. MCCC 1A01428]|uniref:MFS transporter n=1 Tax=Thalassospira sp. MCCC 1A01428 TaxID=1470575 RepID=UPI001FEFE159|nr:MFS transporter [Thalassospira sp. MCCC 1A01428]